MFVRGIKYRICYSVEIIMRFHILGLELFSNTQKAVFLWFWLVRYICKTLK